MKLNLKQRFDIQKYSGLLYSTVRLRLDIESFWQQLAFTTEEYDKYQISPDIEHGITHNTDGDSYLIDVEEPTDVVKNAMKFYIDDNSEANSENEVYLKAKQTFELVL